jgi:hypothetical protein
MRFWIDLWNIVDVKKQSVLEWLKLKPSSTGDTRNQQEENNRKRGTCKAKGKLWASNFDVEPIRTRQSATNENTLRVQIAPSTPSNKGTPNVGASPPIPTTPVQPNVPLQPVQ